MNRVDVGAALEQQLDDPRRSSDDGAMEWRAAGAIGSSGERRVCIQKRAHASDVATLCGNVDGVIDTRAMSISVSP